MSTVNEVMPGESPQRIIKSGNYTYLMYPDFNNPELSEAKWAIKRIDESDADDIKILWAGGTKQKRFKASNRESLTYKTLV